MEQVKFLSCGDCAMTVAFPQEIREETNRIIRFLAAGMKSIRIRGVWETVPTFCSITIYFDPLVITRKKLEKQILHMLEYYKESGAAAKRIFQIPVCYDGEFAPDMEDVCCLTGLTRDQVISLHSSTDYLIYMLGFLPGFPYLGGMDPRLEAPRLDSPRTRIPPGAVGIGGKQTGISRLVKKMADGADIATDIPKYRVWENGLMTGEYTDLSHLWQDDFVYFLIGCSFSFEGELLSAGVPVRHIEEGKNVPMYLTNIDCEEAGIFHGKLVVSMRPMPADQAIRAVSITASMPRVHGAPIHIGDPAQIGISDISKPDFGEAVPIREGEIPVFWYCGVTPQSVVMSAKPPIAISHAPGHMFITDVKNSLLKD